MHYLIIDSTMPEPYGKLIWSPKIENATTFSSSDAATAQKNGAKDATGVLAFNGKWYVIKDSK